MKVIVVHEDGDKETRVRDLAEEVRECVKSGTMRYQGVRVDVHHEDDLSISQRTVCKHCGLDVVLVQQNPLDAGPILVHRVSRASRCNLRAVAVDGVS